ncbi:MAG: sensor histidine kinase [Chloroflexota bacterium]
MPTSSTHPTSTGDAIGGSLQWAARGCWLVACGAPLAIGLASGWGPARTLPYIGLALAALLLVEAHRLPAPLCQLLTLPRWRYLLLWGAVGLGLLVLSGDPHIQQALLCVPFVHAALSYRIGRTAVTGAAYLGVIALGLWLGGQRTLAGLAFPVLAYAALMALMEAFVRVSLSQAEARDRTARLAAELARERDDLARLAAENARLAEQASQSATLAERNRLARELHDTIAQGLTALTMQLEAAQRALDRDPARARARLTRAHELSRATLEDVRRSVWALAEPPVDAAGLAAALEQLTSDFTARSGVAGSFQHIGPPPPIDSAAATQVLRVAQEALQNVEKHAEASSAQVELRVDAAGVRLEVRDDGRGFEGAAQPAGQNGGGFGLLSLRERARLGGGAIEIASGPGQGTCVSMFIARPEGRADGGDDHERRDTDTGHG